MKKIISLLLLGIFIFPQLTFAKRGYYRRGSFIKGYYRKDGAYVSPHYRRGIYVKPSYKSSSSPYKSPFLKSYKYTPSSNYSFSEKKYFKVIDGDTFYYNGKKYRIQGIDTPEKGQYNFEAAKNRLETLLNYGNIEIRETGKDKYGRTIAEVFINGENVADILKREGLGK